jgi:hypothetical protein
MYGIIKFMDPRRSAVLCIDARIFWFCAPKSPADNTLEKSNKFFVKSHKKWRHLQFPLLIVILALQWAATVALAWIFWEIFSKF